VRELSLFYKLFLIDPKERKATQLCPFVKTGIMHRDFQPLLRPDGLGIDYSQLTSYDTFSKIKGQLERQYPYWEGRIKELVEAHNNRNDLEEAITNARRIGLADKKPTLINNAVEVLKKMSKKR
jgi:hypothetical protein